MYALASLFALSTLTPLFRTRLTPSNGFPHFLNLLVWSHCPLGRLFSVRHHTLDLGPAHGAGVLLELHSPSHQARIAAPVHARVDADPGDRAVQAVRRV